VSDVPAGWYPDPTPGAPGLRYWDGIRWTPHVHRPAASLRPLGPTTPDGQPLAGWWHRAGAAGIDSIFGSIVSVVATIPAQISIQREQRDAQAELQRRLDAGDPHALSWFFHRLLSSYSEHLIAYLVPAVIVIVAHTVFLHRWGGSPGQLLTGLRTRPRAAPGTLSWGRALLRVLAFPGAAALLQLLALLSGSLAVLLVIGLIATVWGLLDPLWAAWDPRRQALHDKLVGTNVVRVRR
jgi:uncharacterized RDD family membrane protein YckC